MASIEDTVNNVCEMAHASLIFCHLNKRKDCASRESPPHWVFDTHFTLCNPCPVLGQSYWLSFNAWLGIPFYLPYQMHTIQSTLRTHLKFHLPSPLTKYWSGNRIIKKVRNRTVNAGKKGLFLGKYTCDRFGVRYKGSGSSRKERSLPEGVRGHICWGGDLEPPWRLRCVWLAGKEWGRKSYRKRRYKEKYRDR